MADGEAFGNWRTMHDKSDGHNGWHWDKEGRRSWPVEAEEDVESPPPDGCGLVETLCATSASTFCTVTPSTLLALALLASLALSVFTMAALCVLPDAAISIVSLTELASTVSETSDTATPAAVATPALTVACFVAS